MLPTGTVTFLFTDIEGSTPLWEKMPHEMQTSLAQHHAILRQAIETNGGQVYQIIGDAFQAAFRLTTQGLAAALAAQCSLQSADWGATGPIQVRMGIHTGHAELDSTGNAPYEVSHTLNRAARVMSAGHGGQILLTQEAADLVKRELPEGIALKDLGEHQLKGMEWPEHLFQVLAPDLPQEFPPLFTSIAHPNNLPTQLTSFIGREQEVEDVTGLLEKNRLVTLTGSGGTGKTRLSLQVAGQVLEQFPNGVWFVELAALRDPDLVPRTAITALGLQESTTQSLKQQLKNYLKEKSLLLMLDNCEHVIEDCANLADELIHACPNLKILASSREGLGVAGEITYRVPSLPTPDLRKLPDMEAITHFPAVILFAERAAAVQPGFTITDTNAEAVARICRRLDGIPLAIELAAARVSLLSAEQIANRLNDRFRLLTGGSRTVLPRQQTLRASIDWSYSMLEERERLFLMRLSVFYGGWTLEAAKTVCGSESMDEYELLDILDQLNNKSLVVVENKADGRTRFRMLETIRQYASEKLLDSGEASEARSQHLEYFMHLALSAEPHLRGPQQVEWLDQLETEIDNLRASLEWALEEDPQKGLTLAASIYWMWHIRGYRVEGEHWLNQLFDKLRASDPSPATLPLLTKARVYQSLLQLATGQASSYTTCVVEEAKALSDQLGKEGEATRIHALHALAWNAYANNQVSTGFQLYQQGLEMTRALGDHFLIAEYLMNLCTLEKDLVKSKQYAAENLSLRLELGDLDGLMMAYLHNSMFDYEEGNLDLAKQMLNDSLLMAKKINNLWGTMAGLYGLGTILCDTGNYSQSLEYLHQALRVAFDFGEFYWTAMGLNTLGHVYDLCGDWKAAKEYFLKTIETARANQSKDWEVRGCISLAEAAWKRGELSLAEQYYQLTALAAQKEENIALSDITCYGSGKAAMIKGDPETAKAYFRQSLNESIQQGNTYQEKFCLEALIYLSTPLQEKAGDIARIIGAVNRFSLFHLSWNDRNYYLAPFELEEAHSKARKWLGEEEYNRLLSEGQALTIEQAAILVLGDPGSSSRSSNPG
jgi:predicted ATPase/class 3 adenylate cyclase/tetratricopeptide (TPR) repeat protein